MEGLVAVGDVPTPKAATLVGPNVPVQVIGSGKRFVGRGGDKLEGALSRFPVTVEGRHCLDVGASTGGFTDVLLQRGASDVVAVDVGYGQLAWKLRTDPRVRVVERTNIRHADPTTLGAPFDVIVADLSFISLCTVAPVLAVLASDGSDFILLVKPQFEAGRDRVGKGGIVREAGVHRDVLVKVGRCLDRAGIGVRAAMRSPIEGSDGNVEFLIWGRPGGRQLDDDALVKVVDE